MRNLSGRRWVVAVGAAALAVVGFQFSFGSSSALAATQCTTTYSNTTISGNVQVPAGYTCTLNNVTVTGNVTVVGSPTPYNGGRLEINGGTINGNVQAQPGSTVVPNGPSEGCSDNPSQPPCAPVITVDGSVSLNGIKFNSPNCPNLNIGHGLTINNTDPVAYSCVTVSGNTLITNNPQPLGFAHGTFKGNVTISGNAGIQFGGSTPSLGNTVTGNLYVTNNGYVDVENNTIGGNLTCSGNGSSTFANNSVGGHNQGVSGC